MFTPAPTPAPHNHKIQDELGETLHRSYNTQQEAQKQIFAVFNIHPFYSYLYTRYH